jgi:hypothetical protein
MAPICLKKKKKRHPTWWESTLFFFSFFSFIIRVIRTFSFSKSERFTEYQNSGSCALQFLEWANCEKSSFAFLLSSHVQCPAGSRFFESFNNLWVRPKMQLVPFHNKTIKRSKIKSPQKSAG